MLEVSGREPPMLEVSGREPPHARSLSPGGEQSGGAGV